MVKAVVEEFENKRNNDNPKLYFIWTKSLILVDMHKIEVKLFRTCSKQANCSIILIKN